MDALVSTQITRLSKRGTWSRAVASSSVAATSYRTELSVTGKGYLLFVAGRAGNRQYPSFRITIDGNPANVVTQGDLAYYGYSGPSFGGTLVVFNIPFNSSLVVETYNPTASAITITTEVDYTLIS